MSPSSTIFAPSSLTDQLDELSTRLILDGVASLSSADFKTFRDAAREQDRSLLADAAEGMAASFANAAGKTGPELTRQVSSGLVDLRSLLEQSEAASMDVASPSASQAEAGKSSSESNASLAEDQDLIVEFIMESREHLVNIEGQMLILERDASAAETLNAVFRAFHTIKGLAGFLEFSSIQSLAHEVETLLDLSRKGELVVTSAIVDIVLESTDVVRGELVNIEQRLEGKPPGPSAVDQALLDRVRSAAKGEIAQAAGLMPAQIVPCAAVDLAMPDELNGISNPAPYIDGKTSAPVTPRRRASDHEARPADAASIRIDTAKLDQLMDMVGEMVIAQTLIGHSPSLGVVKDPRLLNDIAQLARITADVQRITTGMRMVPIGLQFQKTARVIRDLSRRAGKQILLETSGEETEVDKTIAEELSDPLLHMVRNSIDHGIETPAERVALGKDPTARIRLAAYHQSGQIVIAISDDGRGLNKARILAKATERGLVAPGVQLTDNEIFLLIFEAGFSTAETVTDISGRGVGMDVVRRHVQALRGRIDVQSTPGEGTTFLLKLPLTLAMIEGLVVVVGEQRYIAPIFSVREMFRPTADMLSTVQGKSEMVLVRGNLLPIIRLHRRFAKEPRTAILSEGTLVVAEAEGHQFCLFVDDVVGKQEVVIKSLGSMFKDLRGIAGCAILGDGKVGLILDMLGVFKGASH